MTLKTGTLVADTQHGRLGYVMGHEGPYVQLRPPPGGREWDADPVSVRLATDEERRIALRQRALALNALSRAGLS